MMGSAEQNHDMFPGKSRRGRPRTSSPAKRRSDNAARQARFRARQRLKAQIVDALTAAHVDGSPATANLRYELPLLLAYLSGSIDNAECDLHLEDPADPHCIGAPANYAQCLELLEAGYTFAAY